MIPTTIADASPTDPFLLLPLPDSLPSEAALREQAAAIVSTLSSHLSSTSPSSGSTPLPALAARMRSTNRSAAILANVARAGAAEGRNKLDAADVELRAVEYELARVREEMARCMEYEPIYETMDLPDEESFLASVPPDVIAALPSDPESRKYALITARLEAELAAVLEHEERVAALTSERDALVRARREVKNKFDAVDVWLADFAKTSNAMATKIKDVAKVPSAPGRTVPSSSSSTPVQPANDDAVVPAPAVGSEVPTGPPAP